MMGTILALPARDMLPSSYMLTGRDMLGPMLGTMTGLLFLGLDLALVRDMP